MRIATTNVRQPPEIDKLKLTTWSERKVAWRPAYQGQRVSVGVQDSSNPLWRRPADWRAPDSLAPLRYFDP